MEAGDAIDVRAPTEADRTSMVEVMRSALNFDDRWVAERAPLLPLERFRCAYDRGRLVATSAGRPFRQWFGDRSLPMTGIFGVATLPEHRDSGHASRATEAILRGSREAGVPVTALFPAVLAPYRRLGYEIAGTFMQHRIPLDAIPRGLDDPAVRVEAFDPEADRIHDRGDVPRVRSRTHRDDRAAGEDDWQVVTALRGPTQRRGVVALTDAGIEGCATFSYTPSPGHLDIDYGLECRAFFATTGRALRSLLAYARSFRGVGRWITFAGPPNDPTSLLLPEIAVEPAFRYPWMLRILDVPIAFAARGYPAIDASVTFAVADRLFPENRGPWTIQVRGGAGTVSSGGTPASEPIPIGALSSMFSGHLTPRDAARLGYLHGDDPAIAGLAAMFNGPDPWCPFFF